MIAVAFPDVAQTFDRALQEVLAQFLDGATHMIGQVSVEFETAEVDYGFRLMDNLDPNPAVIFLGSAVNKTDRLKVNDPHHTMPFAYEQRASIERRMFVRTKYGSPATQNEAERQAKEVWGQVSAIFESQLASFSQRGIFMPRLQPVPDVLKDAASIVYWGFFCCEIRYTYTCDPAA